MITFKKYLLLEGTNEEYMNIMPAILAVKMAGYMRSERFSYKKLPTWNK